jgi:hypothetical protein
MTRAFALVIAVFMSERSLPKIRLSAPSVFEPADNERADNDRFW